MADADAALEAPGPNMRAKGGSFAGDAFKLASGAVLAQALGLLVAPLLARMFLPEAFGAAAVFASMVQVVGVVVCLRYESAIMLPETDEDASNLLAGSMLFVVVFTALTTLGTFFLGERILSWLRAPDVEPFLWMLPIAVLASGGNLALRYWNARVRRFGLLSRVRVISSAAQSSTKLGLGVMGQTGAGTLIGAGVLGYILPTAGLGWRTWRSDGHMILHSVSRQGIAAGIRRYRKFPLFSTGAALMNSISWQLPTFLLSMFFSSTIVGWYALGTRVLRLPMSLIGDAIAQVFFQRAAEAKIDGSLPSMVESAFRRLVAIGMFPLLILAVVGQDLFVVLFGENWMEAGVYAQILSVWTFFWFISSPLSTLYSVLEKQEFSLAINIVILATRFLSLVIGGVLGDARLALLLFGVTGAIVYGYLGLMIMAASGVSWRTMGNILLSSFLLFIPAGLILVALKLLGATSLVLVGVACILLIIHSLYTLRNDPQLRELLGQLLVLKKPAG